jgi:hypothetical protein
MTPNEELDLARAKVMAARRNAEWDKLDGTLQEWLLRDAVACRLDDEARGLRVVPVEATEEMIKAARQKMGSPSSVVAKKMWSEYLAASPFAPEEKG